MRITDSGHRYLKKYRNTLIITCRKVRLLPTSQTSGRFSSIAVCPHFERQCCVGAESTDSVCVLIGTPGCPTCSLCGYESHLACGHLSVLVYEMRPGQDRMGSRANGRVVTMCGAR